MCYGSSWFPETAKSRRRPLLPFTPNDAANRLLGREPLALVIGLVLDQQIKMEKAWAGPYLLAQRLDGSLDARRIAALPAEEFDAIFRQKPALHRFPGNMAARTRAVCQAIVARYDGDARGLWQGARDAAEVSQRFQALPGIGPMKAKMAVTILGRFLGVPLAGWEELAAVCFAAA